MSTESGRGTLGGQPVGDDRQTGTALLARGIGRERGPALSDDAACCGEVAGSVTGVDGFTRLDQQDLGPVDRHRLVLHSPGNYINLARAELDVAGVQPD